MPPLGSTIATLKTSPNGGVRVGKSLFFCYDLNQAKTNVKK